MPLGLELHQVVAEQSAQQRLVGPRRQEPQDVRRRKGDVPELMDEERGAHRPQILREKAEVVVLDPYHRAPVADLGLLGDRVREADVDGTIALPVLAPELEMLDEHVTEGPQRLVGEAVVVAVDVRRIEPDAAQGVGRVVGGNAKTPLSIGDLPVARAGAPRNPGPMDASHRRIERRHQPTRGLLDGDPGRAPDVLVGLAVGDEDELAVGDPAFEFEHAGDGGNRCARGARRIGACATARYV